MPYYARSAYYPLPGAPQAVAQSPQPQQQQQYAGQPAQPPLDQVYRQYGQVTQQLAYQQQQQQVQLQRLQQLQLQQQQYNEEQNRQLALQQQQQQIQLQQQQYASQHKRQQVQQYAQQQTQQQQQASLQQLKQVLKASRQQQPQQHQQQRSRSPAAPLYKSSDYVTAGGVYFTGGAYNQPSLRRAASRTDVNTAVDNQEAPYQSYGQGLSADEQQRVSQYNPYAGYGQTAPQSPLRAQRSSKREPSEYAYDGLNPVYRQQAQQRAEERDLPTAREQPSASNVWLGARTLNAPTTVVLDANNNNVAPLPPRSPARGYGIQKGQVESAYISIPNNLQYAQSDQQRAAYNNYGAQESRPAYASSSRTNQAQLKPAAARELYAALSSENVRTALERDAPVLAQVPAYATYNGQKVQGRAFVVPANQKYSEYNVDELNGLRSVIDR